MLNTTYADQLVARHAAYTAQARRADRIAHILFGAIVGCGIVALAALFLYLPTA